MATIHAIQMDHDFVVETLHGPVRGRAGDYLGKGTTGDLWPIQREIFEKEYIEVQPGETEIVSWRQK